MTNPHISIIFWQVGFHKSLPFWDLIPQPDPGAELLYSPSRSWTGTAIFSIQILERNYYILQPTGFWSGTAIFSNRIQDKIIMEYIDKKVFLQIKQIRTTLQRFTLLEKEINIQSFTFLTYFWTNDLANLWNWIYIKNWRILERETSRIRYKIVQENMRQSNTCN